MQQTRPGRPKSQKKKKAILSAAAELFLANGVIKTSMEEVAKHSGVSKQTVYSHYQNKDALFSAVIAGKCDEYLIKAEHVAGHNGCLKTALTQMAKKFLALFHDEAVIAMYTIVIAEAKNSPRVAELFYKAGPAASTQVLSDVLVELSHNNLSQQNAHKLAVDFFNLLKGELHMKSLMCMNFALNTEEQTKFIDSVVERTLCLHQHYYQ